MINLSKWVDLQHNLVNTLKGFHLISCKYFLQENMVGHNSWTSTRYILRAMRMDSWSLILGALTGYMKVWCKMVFAIVSSAVVLAGKWFLQKRVNCAMEVVSISEIYRSFMVGEVRPSSSRQRLLELFHASSIISTCSKSNPLLLLHFIRELTCACGLLHRS